MGISVSYYYGIAEQIKNFLTKEEYEAWYNEEMDENHIIHRLKKNGYNISSSEEDGYLLTVGIQLNKGEYKNYCPNSFFEENWLFNLLNKDFDFSSIKETIEENIKKINQIAGREIIKSAKFYSRSYS